MVRTKEGLEEIKVKEKSQFAAEMDYFSGFVANGTEPLTPGEEGLRDIITLLQAIYRSAREGRPVATGAIH